MVKQSGREPAWKQYMDWCEHYTGIGYGKQLPCKAGIIYDAVFDKETRCFPCVASFAGSTHCDRAKYPTKEEALAYQAESDRQGQEWIENINNDICPQCKQPVRKVQVGPCVYGEPCGHRLYQGTIPGGKR